MKSYLLSALMFSVFLGGAALGQSTAVPVDPFASERENERYRIGFQDTLEVQIFRHPDLNQRVSVNANGTINLFRIPEPIIAVCKTENELAKDIAAAYEKDYLRNPEVKVLAVEQRSQAYAVIGAVEKPGQYFISRPIRLLELLAQAGGHTDKAGSRLVVARTGSNSNCKLNETQAGNSDFTVMDFKLKEVLEAKQNFMMRPGDIVSVLDADVVYVYGNVEKQGQVEMKEPMTLTQAIASAEGLKAATRKDDIRVIRQKPGSLEREEFVYDLNAIAKREITDPYLEPNDIVAVGKDATKSILNSLGRSLTNGIPSLFYRVP
ncbi:MAG: SLBB domain-containing protein [Pyrinomonadaceae bacterium]|nr:SLBB domain-containing protein [Pyrinomonadaceae bacterium]